MPMSPRIPATIEPSRAGSAHTLGEVLERDRLERRVRWMRVAIDALRRSATEGRREPPRHVRRDIADFEAQIAALEARLRELAYDRGQSAEEEWSGDEHGT